MEQAPLGLTLLRTVRKKRKINFSAAVYIYRKQNYLTWEYCNSGNCSVFSLSWVQAVFAQS